MRYHATGPASPLRGVVRVPGDKSLSHRAVLFAAMADGVSHLTGVLDSADVRATMRAVEALGAGVQVLGSGVEGMALHVEGWGARGPSEPVGPIDCGNSGTTARLLLGVLAAWDVTVVLTGDRSLSARPMRRVAGPLTAMGARVEPSAAGTLPVRIRGGGLTAMRHELPVASAQVKSALLLAGLQAEGTTCVCEPSASRDHTERMLPAFGVPLVRDARGCACVTGPRIPASATVAVPGDPSSAAFLVAAALLVPGSEVELPGVCLNPTRTGFLRVLARMGARIDVALNEATAEHAGEPVGTIRVKAGADPLQATVVEPEEVPSLVDEVPVLAVVAAAARGSTTFSGIGELRVKESDRLAAIVDGLRALGARAESRQDTLVVHGPSRFHSAALDALGDHRLAMAFAVAGLAGTGDVAIDRFEAVDVSYPAFARDLQSLA